MAVNLHTVALLLESQQVQHIIPLALLLDHVDVVVDELQELFLEHFTILPLVVDDCPDVLLLYLVHFEILETVV